MSAWSAESLRRYVATRFPLHGFGPLAAGLAVAGAVAGGAPAGPLAWASTIGVAALLLFQFRLWDDLADVDEDRVRHPERVLARTARLRPVWILMLATGAANLAAVAARPAGARRLVVLALLDAAAALWYGGGRAACRGRLVRAHVVLVKYPVFVVLLGRGAAPGAAGGLAMGVVYLAAAVYELAHDARLRSAPGAARLLALEIAGLCLGSAVAGWTLVATVGGMR